MTGPGVILLAGGVGGAKLAVGMARVLPEGNLGILVNTGDDFTHMGLRICPDLDTQLYSLAGLSDPVRGWGRAGETWKFMATLQELGDTPWFQLGDADLALHVLRTERLRSGRSLTETMHDVAMQLGVRARLWPMSDDPVETWLDTDEGTLAFQEYFVRRRAEPRVRAIRFAGAETARPNAEAMAALTSRATQAIVIAPSNPFLSVDPILSIPAIRQALASAPAPVIAVSPIISGRALKGPTAELMEGFGMDVSPEAVARHYAGLIDGMIVDPADDFIPGLPTLRAPAIMNTLDEKERLATAALSFAKTLQATKGKVT
jgi:LPPG:FO 2-phospho-L-lactate transferase